MKRDDSVREIAPSRFRQERDMRPTTPQVQRYRQLLWSYRCSLGSPWRHSPDRAARETSKETSPTSAERRCRASRDREKPRPPGAGSDRDLGGKRHLSTAESARRSLRGPIRPERLPPVVRQDLRLTPGSWPASTARWRWAASKKRSSSSARARSWTSRRRRRRRRSPGTAEHRAADADDVAGARHDSRRAAGVAGHRRKQYRKPDELYQLWPGWCRRDR